MNCASARLGNGCSLIPINHNNPFFIQTVTAMKQIHFFALKDDLLPVLDDVERDGFLKYVRTGNCLSGDFDQYLHGADIPYLGKASARICRFL